ncbi:hypothetical protein N7492_003933 [Penicillium capsulatum]|uniref:Cyclin-D1-binding protein 1-like N-terminal domain-containing protein n=1 Tax=Penicillium capsulatum TaxID=69766 RepID=A0A9W9IM70_9EURO|nr:hypothetical protein N7492_003933 [Penicillium capsulatum]KAJ6121489.1 hypothetical protein N7512_003954 [Penicillium capsulatum]
MSKEFTTVTETTLALIEQFQGTLGPSAAANTSESTKDVQALPLLSASSTALKAQVTKLSLLAINPPFTHSAVSTVLRACNDSVLPSLVTAALLVTPAEYTKAFHSEVLLLTRTTLTEFAVLVQAVKSIAGQRDQAKKDDPKRKEDELPKTDKDAVTQATGRVWDACDTVVEVSSTGVIGFVMRRVEQWRDLVRDAVEEIEEWDPEEDDDFFDDLMGDEKADDEDKTGDDSNSDEDTAALQEQKKATLRFLKPIAQVYPAIINNRLKNAGDKPLSSAAGIAKLESLLLHLHSIPEGVDEAAGALYEDNVSKSVKFLKDIQKSASQAVESVVSPWSAADATGNDQASEDKFTIWSRTWFKVVDEVAKSIDTKSSS